MTPPAVLAVPLETFIPSRAFDLTIPSLATKAFPPLATWMPSSPLPSIVAAITLSDPVSSAPCPVLSLMTAPPRASTYEADPIKIPWELLRTVPPLRNTMPPESAVIPSPFEFSTRRGVQRDDAVRKHIPDRRSLDFQVDADGAGAAVYPQSNRAAGYHQIIERYACAADAENRVARRGGRLEAIARRGAL